MKLAEIEAHSFTLLINTQVATNAIFSFNYRCNRDH